MKNRDIYSRRYKIHKILYTGQWHLSPLQSRHLGISHSSPNGHHLPHCVFLNLIKCLKSLPFQFWEKPEVSGCHIWAVQVWATWGIWCFIKKLFMRRDVWVNAFSWWSCHSPVVHSCSLLNHLNSFHGGTFNLHAKFDADSLFYSLCHFEYDSYTVHMLTQECLPPPLTSAVKSSLFTNAHFQSTLLGCQVTSVLRKLFLLCLQWLDFFWTDLIYIVSVQTEKPWNCAK